MLSILLATVLVVGMPLACRLDAFTPDERTRHHALGETLARAVLERRELRSGFAFRLTDNADMFQEAAEWVALERRCCPFLRFKLEWNGSKGGPWISLTGPPGTKAFLGTALGMLER